MGEGVARFFGPVARESDSSWDNSVWTSAGAGVESCIACTQSFPMVIATNRWLEQFPCQLIFRLEVGDYYDIDNLYHLSNGRFCHEIDHCEGLDPGHLT